LIPLTISQYLKAVASGKDGEISVDGKELKTSNFRLVGRVIAIEERSTQWAFTLDDSTGRMDVSLWIDLEENEFIASRRASWMYVVVLCVKL
jgi:replication factor A2